MSERRFKRNRVHAHLVGWPTTPREAPNRDRAKYVQRRGLNVYFRYKGNVIGRLPVDEASPEFAAAYDELLAEVMAGKHGKPPRGPGRKPKGFDRRTALEKALEVEP